MKRNVLSLISLCLLFVFTVGCGSDFNRFEGSDNFVTITRDLSSFDRISVNDDMEVNVVQSNTRLVEIVVNENLQDQLITRVNNNTLDISLADGSYKNESFKINIQVPVLKSISLNDNTRANVDITSDELEVNVDDSSDLKLQGSANVLNINNNDDGSIKGFSFTTEILNTFSDDASDLEITCNGELNGSVNDASRVRYRGKPTVSASTSDAGRIIDAN